MLRGARLLGGLLLGGAIRVSLFAELKRRSVFKVGAAYLVVGWLVVQAASIAFPTFEAPAWALRAFILVVLLGFPIALVLAWTFDITPAGVKVDPAGVGTKRLYTTAAIMAALAVGWFMRGGYQGSSEAELGATSTAVLPFVNMSSDKENEYFSDGLTETLLHKLAQVPELKVAARTSSFAFKGKQHDIREIGRQLGVATVVEGSVQRAGDTLRITAQLVRTADGSHIWSRNYDRKLADLFAIQDEIAGAVAEALVGALVPSAKAAIAEGGTKDIATYDLYTKALALRAIGSFDALAEGERALTKALERDPKFVDALLLLANTRFAMAFTGMISVSEMATRVTPGLDRVDALDPGNATALAWRGALAGVRGEDAAARALYERALAAAPLNVDALIGYANQLNFDDDADRKKGMELLARAAAVDPLNALVFNLRAGTLLAAKDYDGAEASARRAVELAPKGPFGYQTVGGALEAQGRSADAFVWWRKSQVFDPTDHELASELGLYLDELGEPAAADAWFAESARLAPKALYVATHRTVTALSRGDLEGAYAGGLAIVGRHAEERRGNWAQALSSACLAAVELGRSPQLRAALEQAGAVPRDLTPEAFKALATPEFDVKHQLAHLARLAPCLFDLGPAGAARREQMLATADAVLDSGWAESERYDMLAATLRADREAMVIAIVTDPVAAPRGVVPLERMLRWRGVADDPRIAARFVELKTKLAEQRVRLPKIAAEERVALLPAAPAAAVAP